MSITCIGVALKGSLSSPYNFSSSANTNCPQTPVQNCLELEHIPDHQGQGFGNQQITDGDEKINGTISEENPYFIFIRFLLSILVLYHPIYLTF